MWMGLQFNGRWIFMTHRTSHIVPENNDQPTGKWQIHHWTAPCELMRITRIWYSFASGYWFIYGCADEWPASETLLMSISKNVLRPWKYHPERFLCVCVCFCWLLVVLFPLREWHWFVEGKLWAPTDRSSKSNQYSPQFFCSLANQWKMMRFSNGRSEILLYLFFIRLDNVAVGIVSAGWMAGRCWMMRLIFTSCRFFVNCWKSKTK